MDARGLRQTSKILNLPGCCPSDIINEIEDFMSIQHSYVKELEFLILDQLLPVYIKYYKEKGYNNPLHGINPKLLAEIKKAKKLPALLRPYEIQS